MPRGPRGADNQHTYKAFFYLKGPTTDDPKETYGLKSRKCPPPKYWPQKMTNVSLYARCKAEPITNILKRLRWQLFGHILRLPEDTPASLTMAAYFTHDEKTWRGRPRVTIVTKLSEDLAKRDNGRLVSLGDLQRLRILAMDRALGVQGGEDSVPSYVPLDWITQNGYNYKIIWMSSKKNETACCPQIE